MNIKSHEEIDLLTDSEDEATCKGEATRMAQQPFSSGIHDGKNKRTELTKDSTGINYHPNLLPKAENLHIRQSQERMCFTACSPR